jgi:hypothetical protein
MLGLFGILAALFLLMWLAYQGGSVLLLAPAAALVAAAVSGEPPLASWTQTFMGSAAQFVAQFFAKRMQKPPRAAGRPSFTSFRALKSHGCRRPNAATPGAAAGGR